MSGSPQLARGVTLHRRDARPSSAEDLRRLPRGVGLVTGLVVSLTLWGVLGAAAMRWLF